MGWGCCGVQPSHVRSMHPHTQEHIHTHPQHIHTQISTVPYPLLGENTLVVSGVACVCMVDGALTIMWRVGDTYANQMVEVHARAYVLRYVAVCSCCVQLLCGAREWRWRSVVWVYVVHTYVHCVLTPVDTNMHTLVNTCNAIACTYCPIHAQCNHTDALQSLLQSPAGGMQQRRMAIPRTHNMNWN